MDKVFEALQHLQAWVLLLVFFAGYLWKGFNKLREPNTRQDAQIKNLEIGMKSLLRAEIVREVRKCQTRGYRTLEETEAITGLFDAYLGVHGNGVIKDLYRHSFLGLEMREKHEFENTATE